MRRFFFLQKYLNFSAECRINQDPPKKSKVKAFCASGSVISERERERWCKSNCWGLLSWGLVKVIVSQKWIPNRKFGLSVSSSFVLRQEPIMLELHIHWKKKKSNYLFLRKSRNQKNSFNIESLISKKIIFL